MDILRRAREMQMTGSEFVWIICRTALPDPPSDIFHDGMFGEISSTYSSAAITSSVFRKKSELSCQ